MKNRGGFSMRLGGHKSASGIASPLLLGLDQQRVLILGCDDLPEREHRAVLPVTEPQTTGQAPNVSLDARAASLTCYAVSCELR